MHGQQHTAGIGDAVERHGQNNAQRHAQRGQHQLFCVELRFCHKRSLSSQKKAAKTRPCFMRGACLRGFLVFMMMDARVCMQSRTGGRDAGEMRAFMAAVPCYYSRRCGRWQVFCARGQSGERGGVQCQICKRLHRVGLKIGFLQRNPARFKYGPGIRAASGCQPGALYRLRAGDEHRGRI